jgi:hypothetical protein
VTIGLTALVAMGTVALAWGVPKIISYLMGAPATETGTELSEKPAKKKKKKKKKSKTKSSEEDIFRLEPESEEEFEDEISLEEMANVLGPQSHTTAAPARAAAPSRAIAPPAPRVPKTDDQINAEADYLINRIETVQGFGNQSVYPQGSGYTLDEKNRIRTALRNRYAGTAVGDWAGARVRYYIVGGAGDKIDITGHQFSRTGDDLSLRNGTNVFNYHVQW